MHAHQTSFTNGAPEDGLNRLVERLEELQAGQFSPQQPSAELDGLIARVVRKRPEWRSRLAVKATTTLLRQKILNVPPEGGRQHGSAMLGKSHIWREKALAHGNLLRRSCSDHNWPKLQKDGLPEGGPLPAPVERMTINPTMTHSFRYSFPRAKRFADGGITDVNEPGADKLMEGTPGPGAYLTSQAPNSVPFSVKNDGTVVYGANHMFPWKGMLDHSPLNPSHLDVMVQASGPKHSFPKSRRETSEPLVGRMRHIGEFVQSPEASGPWKTDAGTVAPGPVYEHYSTFHPAPMEVDRRRLQTLARERHDRTKLMKNRSAETISRLYKDLRGPFVTPTGPLVGMPA